MALQLEGEWTRWGENKRFFLPVSPKFYFRTRHHVKWPIRMVNACSKFVIVEWDAVGGSISLPYDLSGENKRPNKYYFIVGMIRWNGGHGNGHGPESEAPLPLQTSEHSFRYHQRFDWSNSTVQDIWSIWILPSTWCLDRVHHRDQSRPVQTPAHFDSIEIKASPNPLPVGVFFFPETVFEIGRHYVKAAKLPWHCTSGNGE